MTKPFSRPDTTGRSPEQFWQDLYRQVLGTEWAARVNPRLAEFAESLAPGSALDLGCGQGGDTLWLARRGWHVTAVDIAEAALQRVRSQAEAENLGDQVVTEQHDLASSLPTGAYDLVSAQFLQTVFAFPRARILSDLAARIRPQGLLLIVDHGSVAPWSWDQDAQIPDPEQTLSELGLDPAAWQTVVCEALPRTATGPGGQVAEVLDNVIAVRRSAT